MKTAADFVTCPGVLSDGLYAHSMRDNCWSCAPFWEKIPVCPKHQAKLSSTGWCKLCHKHYDIREV